MKIHGLAVGLLAFALSTCLAPRRAEPGEDPKETRVYDLSTVLGPRSAAPIFVRPQGNLVFSNDVDPPELSLFGYEREGELHLGHAISFEDPQKRFHESREAVKKLISLSLRSAGVTEEESGAPNVAVRGGFLFVEGSKKAQDAAGEIARLLRRHADQRFLVECVLVPQEVLSGISADWRSQGPYLDGEIMERALLDRRSRLLSAVAPAGRWVTSGNQSVPALMVDYEVNCTGVLPVLNPLVRAPTAGNWLHVRAFPVPGERSAFLDLAIGRFRVESSKAELGVGWSDLHLPVTEEALFSVSTVIEERRALHVASLGGDEALAALVRLRRQAVQEGEEPSRGAEGILLRAYDASLILRTDKKRRWWRQAFWDLKEDYEGSDEMIDAAVLTDFLKPLAEDEGALGGDNWMRAGPPEGALFLHAPKATHEKVEDVLGWEIRRSTRLAAVDLEIVDLSREALVQLRSGTDDGFHLETGWRKALEGEGELKSQRYALTAVPGEAHALRLAKLHSLVTDVENVSGGTGFTIIEVPDPVVSTCGEGTEFRIQVDFLPQSKSVRLQLQGVDTRLKDIREVPARHPSLAEVSSAGAEAAGEQQGSGAPAQARLGTSEMFLNLPKQSVKYYAVERQIPVGREVILQSDAAEEEGGRLLIARVRRLR